jgi:Tol biopolymer transport system component
MLYSLFQRRPALRLLVVLFAVVSIRLPSAGSKTASYSSALVSTAKTGIWTGVAKMNTTRANHTATLLPSGKGPGVGGQADNRIVDYLAGGPKIVFGSVRNGRNHDIFTMDLDGANQTRLTTNPAYDDQPKWSPDGNKIVFMSNRDGNFEIYSMNADGSNQTRLTNNPAADGFPAWSPDGDKIAFVSGDLRNPATFEIYVMNADGSNRTKLTNDSLIDGVPAWSPDGTKIVFMSGGPSLFDPNSFEIFVMNADGSNRTRLTNNTVADGQPSYSPDGTKILFASGDAMNPNGIEIYLMNANGSNRTQLTNNSKTDGFPAWSADGAKIIFASGSVADETTVELFVMNADGSNRTQLTNNSALDWFPDYQPTLPGGTASIQFSAANYSAGEGDVGVVITVNRTGDLSGTSTVDFTTSDGTAKQKSDYEINTGTLTFAAGDTSKTFKVLIVDDAFVEGNETLNLTLSNPTGANLIAPSSATVTIVDNDSASATSPIAKQFVANLTGSAEVPPNTSTATGGAILQLNANDTSLLFSLVFSGLSGPELIARVHGPSGPTANAPVVYSQPTQPQIPNGSPVTDFTINPTAQEVTDLRAGLHYMNVHVSTPAFTNGEIRGQFQWNPMEEADSFVRQAYFDFLSRSPDTGGLAFWAKKITDCQSGVQCLRDARVDVSNQFYAELEFQQTGAYVYRLYRAAYGNNQPFPNPNPDPLYPNVEKTMPSYPVFVADRTRVIGSANLAQSQLDLATAFVQRPEFLVKYPASLASGDQFVTEVLNTIKNDLGADLTPQKGNLITNFNTGGRALVMFHLANDYWNKCAGGTAPCLPAGFGTAVDNRLLIDAEYNRAFVLTEYWGYLRRNPDLGGFTFWLGRVNSAPLRNLSQQRAMVCVFATSAEFQNRFGPVASRNNNECQ